MLTKKIIKLLKRGDAREFHAFCRDMGDEPMSLAGETIANVDLTGFEFNDFDLSNTEWQSCTLSSTKFEESDLSGAYFVGCGFIDTTVADCNLDGAAFDGAVFRRCVLETSDMTGTELENCQLENCKLTGCKLEDITWTSITVSGGSLSDLDGATGTFKSVKLRNVVLERLNIADLEVASSFHTGCTLTDAELPAALKVRKGRRLAVGS